MGSAALVEQIVQIITAVVSAIAIVVTVVTAITSTRSSAFNDLKVVVEQMKVELTNSKKVITQLEIDFSRERRLRMQYEDYIHALINQLRDSNIVPIDMSKYVEKTDDSL